MSADVEFVPTEKPDPPVSSDDIAGVRPRETVPPQWRQLAPEAANDVITTRGVCLRRAAFVPMVEAADLWSRDDGAIRGRRDLSRDRRIFVERGAFENSNST